MQTHEIVENGIVGFERIKRNLGTSHRRPEDTAKEREYAKLLGKSNWYKKKNTK